MSPYSVIVSTDSRLKTTDAWVVVPGYRVIHSLREKLEDGGVTNLFKDDLYAQVLPSRKISNNVKTNL